MGREKARPGPSPRSFGSHLEAARRAAFVGRQAELDWFVGLLGESGPTLAWIHGPAGMGKSTLLRRMRQLATEGGHPCAVIDLHDTPASPTAIAEALAIALGEDEGALADALAREPGAVLFFDTWERGTLCEGWMREAFLPSLPQHTRVFFAGREPPGGVWRSDPGWRELLRVRVLEPLSSEDARLLLANHDVPEAQQDAALASAHGHPLALTLVGELARQPGSDPAFALAGAPDLVAQLLDRFVTDVPSQAHRVALRLCAHARVTDEAMLREVLQTEDAPDLFDWLRDLPFIALGPRGLYPHDLARDVIDSEHRWRDPQGYAAINQGTRHALMARVREWKGQARQSAWLDLVYLCRVSRHMHAFFDFDRLGSGWIDSAKPEDREPMRRAVRNIEGEAGLRGLDAWLEHDTSTTLVLRNALGEPVWFETHLTLPGIGSEEAALDPIVGLLGADIEARGGLRAGERVTIQRYLYPFDANVAPGREFRFVYAHPPRWVTDSSVMLGYTLSLWPKRLSPYLRMLGYECSEALDPTGKHAPAGLGYFLADLRSHTPDVMLDRAFERLIAEVPIDSHDLSTPPQAAPLLSRADFDRAVKQALKDFDHQSQLERSQLLKCRMIDTPGPAGAERLRALLCEALDSVGPDPRASKLERAVRTLYLQGAPSQEIAAERLGLPFSTYRRHLSRGIERVTDWLWQRERRTTPSAR